MVKYNKVLSIIGIIWASFWIYFIISRYPKQTLYLWFSEFAAVITILVLSSILLQVKGNKKEMIRFLGLTILLGFLFGIPIYALSKSIFVLIYLGLSIIFNLVYFYFLELDEKVNSFKLHIKNIVLLMLSGVGLGIFSILVYHILKIIDRTLTIFNIELIKFGAKK